MKHYLDVYLETLAERVAEYEATGDERAARITTRIATELRERRLEWEEEQLSNVQAAAESGYTAQALGRLRSAGQWSGKRKDLPRHANAAPIAHLEKPSSNVVSIAERALQGKNGASRVRSMKS